MQREIMRLNLENKKHERLIKNIWDLPTLDKSIQDLIDFVGEEDSKSDPDSSKDSEIKLALLNASDLSKFEDSDSFFLTENEVGTLMEN